MAYINQDQKKEKAAAIKKIISEKYADLKIKYTMGIEHYTKLRFTISASLIDFKKIYADNFINGSEFNRSNDDNWQVSGPWIEEIFTGKVLELFQDVKSIMNSGNYDNSDLMTDYFDVGWYINITIGRWNKPYILLTE